MKKSILASTLALSLIAVFTSAHASPQQPTLKELESNARLKAVEKHLEPVETAACFNEKGNFDHEIILDKDGNALASAVRDIAAGSINALNFACRKITTLKVSDEGLSAVDKLQAGDIPTPSDFQRLSLVCSDTHTGHLVQIIDADKPYIQCQYVIVSGFFNPSVAPENLPDIRSK